MNRDDVAFGALLAVVLIALIIAIALNADTATNCARACGPGRMGTYTETLQGPTRVPSCVCAGVAK